MKRKHYKKSVFLRIFLVLVFFLASISFLEIRMVPALKEISHMQCKTAANTIINEALFKQMDECNIPALLKESEDHFTANTALINSFCALLSENITEDLKNLPPESIRIPIGAVTNFSLFSDAGPSVPFTLIPMGAVAVDYETAFSSAGINQINYKIWLYISIEMKIVNPLYQETIHMDRKIMLADMIFSGKVPEHYFQFSLPDEYLLTE